MTARFELPAKLDTASVPALVEALRARQGSDLALEASALEHIGALALQALIVAANDWQDGGHRLSFENPSEALRDQLRVLGTSPEVLTEGDIR